MLGCAMLAAGSGVEKSSGTRFLQPAFLPLGPGIGIIRSQRPNSLFVASVVCAIVFIVSVVPVVCDVPVLSAVSVFLLLWPLPVLLSSLMF